MADPTITTQLPATAVPEDRMTAEPITEIAEGDLVVVFSRGTYRLAKVTKLGPKRITVIYTTQGAWTEAQKIADHLRSLSDESIEHRFDYLRDSDYYVADAPYVEGEGGQGYSEAYIAASVARQKSDRAAAREHGAAPFVHVTTKSVPRGEVFGLVAEAV